MDYKEATTILIHLVKNDKLTAQEKEAVDAAIGVLAWASLSKSTMQKLKDKKEKSARWE